MPTVIILSQLKEGIEADAYEKWVREFDYPTATTIPSILSYRNCRVRGAFRQADVPYEYIEVIEVTSMDEYRHHLDTLPQYQELRRQLAEFIRPAQSYWGDWIQTEP